MSGHRTVVLRPRQVLVKVRQLVTTTHSAECLKVVIVIASGMELLFTYINI